MIVRLSQRLATKLKVRLSTTLPPCLNPFADWSANLFTAERTQFVIITNTVSLYSTVFHGRGISNDGQFIGRALDAIREFLEHDELEVLCRQIIAPVSGEVQFSKSLNRSVTGSMNDLVAHARMWLTEGDLSPQETSSRLNDIPFSSLAYRKPREVFKSLTVTDALPVSDDS